MNSLLVSYFALAISFEHVVEEKGLSGDPFKAGRSRGFETSEEIDSADRSFSYVK
jgi:hypothetical protein